jgi:hypothetical protein
MDKITRFFVPVALLISHGIVKLLAFQRIAPVLRNRHENVDIFMSFSERRRPPLALGLEKAPRPFQNRNLRHIPCLDRYAILTHVLTSL